MIRLIIIQNKLKAPKSQYNSFGKYNYRNIEDILEALKPLLHETKTALTFADEIVMIGTRYYVKSTAVLKGDDGNVIEKGNGYAREEESQKGKSGEQVTGSATTYARKRAADSLFLLDDTRDADSNGVHAPSTSAAPKAATSAPAKAPTTAPELERTGAPSDDEEPRAEIARLLMEMCNGDKEEAVTMLEVLTTFTGKDGKEVKGKRATHDLSDKHAVVTLRKAREQHTKWLAAVDAPPPEDDIPFEWPEDMSA